MVNPSAWGVVTSCLEEIAVAGSMDGQHRAIALFAAWLAVHGLASILDMSCQAGTSNLSPELMMDRVLHVVKRSLGMPGQPT